MAYFVTVTTIKLVFSSLPLLCGYSIYNASHLQDETVQ
jgi:hypothetical protein